MIQNLALIVSAASLGASTLATIPGLRATIRQVRDRVPKDNFYQDEDGKATPEAIADFSNTVPKVLLLVSSSVGLTTALSVNILPLVTQAAVNESSFTVASCLFSAQWAILLLQSVFITVLHSSVKCYELGHWSFFSAILACIVAAVQVPDFQHNDVPIHDIAIRASNTFSLIVFLFASLSLPRRPKIVFEGKPVDAEWTGSALSRFTWAWASPILRVARLKGDLSLKDIPWLENFLRAKSLLIGWQKVDYKGNLLWSLFREYGPAFTIQTALTAVRSMAGLGPFWAMLRLVQVLESNPASRLANPELWFLVFVLGFSGLLERWMEGFALWYGACRISIPLRGQLSALVYDKSLRRKNVKSADDAQHSDENGNEIEQDDSQVQKSRQAIVNLVGVDARRAADFAIDQTFLFAAIGKLIVNSAFLLQIVGWIPFLAGFGAWALISPANNFIAKIYVGAQDKLMKIRDKKLSVVNEALQGMRQIKFAALEQQWQGKIMSVRNSELRSLKTALIADSCLFMIWFASPILLTSACLFAYVMVNGNLPASVAFVSVGIFKSLEFALSIIPEIVAGGLDTWVSLQRIQTYLNGPEMEHYLSTGPDVAFDGAMLAWPVDEEVPIADRFVLKNVDLSFPAGELSVIAGKTGSGKSLLLSALLGEADLLGGAVQVPRTCKPWNRQDNRAHPGNWILPGSVAFVGQTPWLESASFRDNILFGLPYLEGRYTTVLEVCALRRDLEILPDGEKTELGANGINLSGGQKWRLTLARAIYSRAEILVMDDIFSAVDAHVGRHIFEQCIAGDICRKRTRILVTHHVNLVESHTKYLVELGDETVLHSGLTSELEEENVLERLRSHVSNTEYGEPEVEDLIDDQMDDLHDDNDANALHRVPSKTAKQFVEEETRETGTVKLKVYSSYMTASGGLIFWVLLSIIYVGFEASSLGQNWWLRKWTGQNTQNAGSPAQDKYSMAYMSTLETSTLHGYAPHQLNESSERSVMFYLGVYLSLSVLSMVLASLRVPLSFYMSLKASRTLFEQILFSVMHTKLRWLDTVPVGRILNRLSADFDTIDNHLTLDLTMMLRKLLPLFTICAAGILVSVYILPIAIVLLIASGLIVRVFMRGARPVKRLESVTKSPVFEFFNASLSGISTLRAFQKSQVYTDRMFKLLDIWNGTSMYNWVLNRWMAFRMSLVAQLFSTVLAAVVVSSSSVDAAMAGFALSFALEFSTNVLMATRAYANVELDMNAAERVVEYIELETEDLGGEQPPAAWPTTGNIEVKDLTVAYAEDLPPVLKNISFSIKNRERIGVIGRTGAGKSSLTLALFRFLNTSSGSIHIDGVDISKLNLAALRSRLAIIPQDPVLFSGTLRSNLDPFENHTDAELIECLARVHLTNATPAIESTGSDGDSLGKSNNPFDNLSSPISEGGGNLSQGQRQLLCIARSIVSRPKIMVLDEATSAVDMATDSLIQRSIREEFDDSTLLVIAHRLSTIADFDRILVLGAGEVVEFGTPNELWHKEDGLFRDMCEHSGEKEELKRVILEKEN